MHLKKLKNWFKKYKKRIVIGGAMALTGIGIGILYARYKNNEISFSEWLEMASTDELEEIYEKERLDFCKTGTRSYEMEQISKELGERGAEKWFSEHPPSSTPPWTDKNRWEKD